MTASERVVICGAGIAGVAAAYALTRQGRENVTIVEPGIPLSLTSDKSTEAYRNWWPGPDRAMTAFMNRSIDLMEGIARATGNRINLNRRGYVFATADRDKIPFLKEMAQSAEARGGGPARLHETASSDYQPSPKRGFDFPLTGADVITDAALIRRHFPYLAEETVALVHARRAGWLSAQQLGAAMLEMARAAGVKLTKGRVVGFDTAGDRIRAVQVEDESGGRQALEATHVVLAAGPMQKELVGLLGVALPVYAECHHKVSFHDPLGVVPQQAPMLIWLDEQHLPWSDEEAAVLREDTEAAWLLKKFPAGVHGRPDGATLLVLFNHHGEAVEPVFPLPEEPHYEEIALRGMSTMLPSLRAYQGQPARACVDGGYYIRTEENRPLIGPLPVEGAYISCAYSGFGVMASCAGGDLVARHVTGAKLPDYAPSFLLSRYQDPAYRALLASWGDGGQL
jgi:glycine/D-amino acid oxidase-like deaminating enzyme